MDAVVGGHGQGRDINRSAATSHAAKPWRPFFEFELPPYSGAAVRHNLDACLLGGGHYFFHNDADQETPTTGIMTYDPNVKDGCRESVRERLRWLGIACRALNERRMLGSGMSPRNDVIREGDGYCLAAPDLQYLVYIQRGGQATLRLDHPAADFRATAVSPRSGAASEPEAFAHESELRLALPDESDWLIVVQRN